jgi:hypothetical protein
MIRKSPDRPATPDPQEERLHELGRQWFAEAREQSAHDDAEVEHWRRESKKWHGHRNDRAQIFEDYWLRGGNEPDDAPPPKPQLKRSAP